MSLKKDILFFLQLKLPLITEFNPQDKSLRKRIIWKLNDYLFPAKPPERTTASVKTEVVTIGGEEAAQHLFDWLCPCNR